jgi:hypothetical protein
VRQLLYLPYVFHVLFALNWQPCVAQESFRSDVVSLCKSELYCAMALMFHGPSEFSAQLREQIDRLRYLGTCALPTGRVKHVA